MRKQKKYHLIYRTTNLINDKYYIGMHSTSNLDDGYLGSGKRLWHSINYYGKENFKIEILEYCDNRKELMRREEEIVNEQLISEDLCMNLRIGGKGGWTIEQQKLNNFKSQEKQKILRLDEEWVKKKSKLQSKALKVAYDEGRRDRKQVMDWNGKTHREESKMKMSKSMKGKGKGETNSQFGSCWITNETDNRKIMKGGLIPNGWRLGRKMK